MLKAGVLSLAARVAGRGVANTVRQPPLKY
jgi:hypothetical protein